MAVGKPPSPLLLGSGPHSVQGLEAHPNLLLSTPRPYLRKRKLRRNSETYLLPSPSAFSASQSPSLVEPAGAASEVRRPAISPTTSSRVSAKSPFSRPLIPKMTNSPHLPYEVVVRAPADRLLELPPHRAGGSSTPLDLTEHRYPSARTSGRRRDGRTLTSSRAIHAGMEKAAAAMTNISDCTRPAAMNPMVVGGISAAPHR